MTGYAYDNYSGTTNGSGSSLTWATQPADTQAGQTMPTFTVKVIDQYGNNVPNIPVSITTTNNTLTLYQGGMRVTTYAIAFSDANGLATFDTISMTQAGMGYQFTASFGSIAPVNSNPFNITVGTASSLSWVTQPVTTSAGQTMPAFTVQVTDQYGNNVAVSGVMISITTTDSTRIIYQAGIPATTYTIATSDSNGIAAFDTISMTQAGGPYYF